MLISRRGITGKMFSHPTGGPIPPGLIRERAYNRDFTVFLNTIRFLPDYACDRKGFAGKSCLATVASEPTTSILPVCGLYRTLVDTIRDA